MNKKIIFAVAVIIIATAAYWISIPPWERIKEESIPCGPTNCHGFDVQCGQPAQCELVYQYGDNCRRFVKCAVVNSTCQTIQEQPRFNQCISCVMSCAPMLETDYLKGMECEYRCTL
ncbi:MAG: hypothetical protein J4400_02285 [Candidatus Aenigmarchaeota archaeon]|nr:hypothetical protein [Candidatus Aenigmarchaeota archaeon]